MGIQVRIFFLPASALRVVSCTQRLTVYRFIWKRLFISVSCRRCLCFFAGELLRKGTKTQSVTGVSGVLVDEHTWGRGTWLE